MHVGGELVRVVIRSVCGSGIGIFDLLRPMLDAHCAQTAYPTTKGLSSVTTAKNKKKRKKRTYASARSKLSFTIPVTFRIISKLSVASANILCDATSAALADTAFPPSHRIKEDAPPLPTTVALAMCGEADGDVALDEGPGCRGEGDVNEPS
jgi:hypothetical protein